MNEGARLAVQKYKADVLCFLHADTIIPQDSVELIRQTLYCKRAICGAFISIIDHLNDTQWGLTMHHYVKTFYLPFLFRPRAYWGGGRAFFGDQMMFCRASDFEAVNGFDETLTIMEDCDLCNRLFTYGSTKEQLAETKGEADGGKMVLVNRTIRTSGRRFERLGELRATYLHFKIALSWWFGMPRSEFNSMVQRIYQDVR
eukprot:scaffold346_cov387-Prasinococcus_capsulatus_cf.AAC.8